ncbi:protease [Shewanella insulae]|uniref:Protease n=1 Tax=Shewanella insulae TaxID=2681496 RepID=A0A6L7I0G2_9GAMM|nr:protease [Shewanella insulae]MXR68821.1 protease [Shewanella insulae]
MNSLAHQALPYCHLIKAEQGNTLTFEISVPANTHWYLLSWHTPFDAWFSNFLTLTDLNSHQSLQYQGALAKRGEPTDEDYLLLPAGESLSVSLDLAQAFAIRPGRYQAALRPLRLYRDLNDKAQSTSLECPTLEVNLP